MPFGVEKSLSLKRRFHSVSGRNEGHHLDVTPFQPIVAGTPKDTEMAPDGLDAVPSHARRGVLWLVVVHITIAFVAAVLVRSETDADLIGILYSALWIGQTSLLGIWCGLGASRHWKRLVGGIIGIGTISLTLGISSGEWDFVQLVVSGAFTAFVSILLLIARGFRVVIQVDSSPTIVTSRLQFSIRQLLALTFVVSSMI